MARVVVDGSDVLVELAWWERPFAGGRSTLAVSRGALRSVEKVDRPTRWSATPGARAGLLVTGVVKLGRWGIGTSTRRFVSVRRWVPALRLAVDEREAHRIGYGEILVSCPDADALVAALGPRR